MRSRSVVLIAGAVASGALGAMAGVFIHGFAQVMWVEDRLAAGDGTGLDADAVLDLVVQEPPVVRGLSAVLGLLLVAAVVVLGFALVRSSRRPPTVP